MLTVTTDCSRRSAQGWLLIQPFQNLHVWSKINWEDLAIRLPMYIPFVPDEAGSMLILVNVSASIQDQVIVEIVKSTLGNYSSAGLWHHVQH